MQQQGCNRYAYIVYSTLYQALKDCYSVDGWMVCIIVLKMCLLVILLGVPGGVVGPQQSIGK